uniref:Uncharacterized protein n=1 Tax=Romanomermis culicivorax TaxID=13658 RepID=A0A915L5N0_ROMCU
MLNDVKSSFLCTVCQLAQEAKKICADNTKNFFLPRKLLKTPKFYKSVPDLQPNYQICKRSDQLMPG